MQAHGDKEFRVKAPKCTLQPTIQAGTAYVGLVHLCTVALACLILQSRFCFQIQPSPDT